MSTRRLIQRRPRVEHLQPKPAPKTDLIIEVEDDYRFDCGAGAGWIPVSHDVPEQQRRVLVRQMKNYAILDGMVRVGTIAFYVLVFGVVAAVIIIATGLAIRIGGA